MKSLRLPALAAVLVLSACSSPAPTESSSFNAEASLEQGPGMMGSGNRDGVSANESPDGSDSTGRGGNMLGSGNRDGGSTNESTVSSDSTGRGGGFLGSGN